MEVGFDMNTNIVETLPWIDYREIFQKIEERGEERGEKRGEKRGEERGEKRGEKRGKVTRDMEIAMNAFRRARPGGIEVAETLKDFGISDDIIMNARSQVEMERAEELSEKKRPEPER
jgi:predicted transposase YdaD